MNILLLINVGDLVATKFYNSVLSPNICHHSRGLGNTQQQDYKILNQFTTQNITMENYIVKYIPESRYMLLKCNCEQSYAVNV